MATYNPPTEDLAIFDPSVFNTADIALTQAGGDARYLRFPTAQGTENLSAINVNGVLTANSGVNFASATPPTSSGTQPLSNDSSTKMPTTAWVQTAITAHPGANLLTSNNTWTGTQNWSNTSLGSLTSSATQPASNDTTTNIPTTAWVQTAITAGAPNLLPLNNTWTGTNAFTNTALPTTTGTLPASNTISTQIPTMDWVQQAITTGGSTLLTNNNTWTGTNDFTNNFLVSSNNFTYSGTLQAGTNSNNYVATNQWVQSAIIASQQQNNTYAGLQETLIYSELPYNYSSIASISATTLYTYGASAVSFAVSKSFNTTAYSTNNGAYFNFNPTNPITTLASSTLLTMNPLPATSFEPCVIAFSADGQYAIVTSDNIVINPSEVYLMSKGVGDAGTLTAVGSLYAFFNDACLSADGQYQLLAEISGSDALYVSSNYGFSFSEIGNSGVWYACAMSATGKYMMGVSQFQGISNSSDYGATWTLTDYPTNSFYKCCMSANGQYQIAVCNDNGNADSMFMSFDYGLYWTLLDGEVGGTKKWKNISITDCGRVAYAFEDTGGVYYTLNYGKTWTNATPATFLNGFKNTFSVNGKYLVGQKSGSIPVFTPFSAIF